jgi:ribonuclease HI
VTVLSYLDDILILHSDPIYLGRATFQICSFFRWLGSIVNVDKSDLAPKQRFAYLGLLWDTIRMTVQLTDARVCALHGEVLRFARAARQQQTWSCRQLASVIGKLSATRVQHRQASLHLCRLNDLKTQAVRRNGWDGHVRLMPSVLADTDWWVSELLRNQPASLLQPPPQATLYVDASPSGWGARVLLHPPPPAQQTELFLQGLWHGQAQTQTSNYHELDAVRHTLSLLLRRPSTPSLHSVVVRSDNTATCYNINRQAAGQNLRLPLQLLLDFVRRQHIYLRARHIPGVANEAADRLSRFSASGDYMIDRSVLAQALARLRLVITADLFATAKNKQHPTYLSMLPDRRAVAQDAFSVPWRDFGLPLIHPPIPLIPRVLVRLQQERMRAVVIVPLWEGHAWAALLRSMTIDTIDLGPADQVLIRGQRMRRNRLRLFPENVLLALVDTRMTQVSGSSSTSSHTSVSTASK